MAENMVRIEGTIPVSGSVTTVPSGTQTVSGTVNTLPIKDPAITGVYAFSADEIPGVVAANNFMSLFNPVGSGKTFIFFGAFISSAAAAASTVTAPMRGFRITTATAGTLQATSAIAEFVSAMPSPVAEVRTGNPTVTLGPGFFNSPPVLPVTNSVTPVHAVVFPGGTGPFTLVAGEGVAFRTNSGDVDQRWNIGMIWGEM